MGSNKGKQQETSSYNNYNTAMNNVEKKDPLQEKRTAYLTKMFDFYTGASGPVDLRNAPDGGMGMSLYNNAKQSHDAGRVGKGLSYTDGNGAGGGYNANFAQQLEAENAIDKDINAAGMLENYHADRYNSTMNEVEGDIDRSFNQRSAIAGMRGDAYKVEANRPKATPWWQSLLGGAAGVASSYVSGGLAGRGGS